MRISEWSSDVCSSDLIPETARNADLVLQPYPGQDAAIAGGILHVILREGWEDKAFCEAHVGADRIEALRRSVEPLTPDHVERRAGLRSEEHTSELQSLMRNSYAVFCLKKKNTTRNQINLP